MTARWGPRPAPIVRLEPHPDDPPEVGSQSLRPASGCVPTSVRPAGSSGMSRVRSGQNSLRYRDPDPEPRQPLVDFTPTWG